MINLTSHLHTWHLERQRVFLRADLNVPLGPDNSPLDTHRLQALRPTLDLLQAKGATIILATHIGRPHGFDPSLSTQHLVPWFQEHGYACKVYADLAAAHQASLRYPASIILLENLRFFPGEKQHDPVFAHQLASLGDFYVNDAFGALHRTDASITQVPLFFQAAHRSIGLLVAQELTMLNRLVEHPSQPSMLILGGGKVSDKLPLLQNFIDKTQILFVGPALSSTFFKAMGYQLGRSPIDHDAVEWCCSFIRQAEDHGITLLLPADFIVAAQEFRGPLYEKSFTVDNFPTDGVVVSIGPKTIELLQPYCMKARTILYNGLMANGKEPATLTSMCSLFKLIGNSSAFSVVAGGDSVAAARWCGTADKISYLSTGGGSTLTYLSGQPLPGLEIFSKK